MSLSDPTSGAGYSFGQILPSSHMTTIATQQPNALDGNNGGTYAMSGAEYIRITSTAAAPIFDLAHNSAGNPCIAVDNLSATGIGIYCAAVGGGNPFQIGSGIGTVEGGSGAGLQWNGGASVLPLLDSRSYDRTQNLHGAIATAQFTYGDSYAGSTKSGWLQTDSSGAGLMSFPLDNLIDLSTLTSVSVYVIGGTETTHSSLPASMPAIGVNKVSILTGTITSLGTQVDTSGTTTVYDAAHTITVSGLSQGITDDDRFVVFVQGETGANAQDNAFLVYAIVATYTVTRVTPGG